MNAYSTFINDTFSIISAVLPSSGNKVLAFSYGENNIHRTNEIKLPSSLMSDYASLTNSKAALFYALTISHADMFGVDHSNIKLEKHKLYTDSISIHHSCYSKNLRRWMNGQKSRKALNRLEYIVLVYCWSIDWYGVGYMDQSHILCRNELVSLCKRILGKTDFSCRLLDLLWYASCKSYADAYSASSPRLPSI